MSMIGKRSLAWMLAPAIVAAVALAPAPSEAALKTKKIWMDKFRPSTATSLGGSTFLVTPADVEFSAALAGTTEWGGMADVKLPAGARIVAATYQHRGWGGETRVILHRVRHGQGAQPLMQASSSVSGNAITPVALAPEADADLVVRPAYRYFLTATVGENAALHGVAIQYR